MLILSLPVCGTQLALCPHKVQRRSSSEEEKRESVRSTGCRSDSKPQTPLFATEELFIMSFML